MPIPVVEYNGPITSDNESASDENGYHGTDPDDSELKVVDFCRMVTTSRNLYNLAGCARMFEESWCTGDTRTKCCACSSRDETYVDPLHFGYKAITPLMPGVEHVNTAPEPIVFIKIPNSVGSPRLNITTLNLYSKCCHDVVVDNTGGSIANYPGTAVR